MHHTLRSNVHRAALCMVALGLSMCIALPVLAQGDLGKQWKAEEARCISACPKAPRFSGSETNEQYQRRMQAQDEQNACESQCTKDYVDKVYSLPEPFNDGSSGYFQRNTF